MEGQASFSGWAVVELFGHQKEIGFVNTEAFGSAVLFRIDVPELEEGREYTLERPEYDGSKFVPAGSVVKRSGSLARTRLVGPGAIYAINPCTEEVARKALERQTPRPLIVVTLAERPQLTTDENPRKACGCDPSEYCDVCEPEESGVGA